MGAVKIIKDIWCDRIAKMKLGQMSREERLKTIKKACEEREKNRQNKYPKDKRKKDRQQTSDYWFLIYLKDHIPTLNLEILPDLVMEVTRWAL